MTGLRNENHRSCNVLSALHLLCQTNLPNITENQIIHENCQAHGACLLGQFFVQYQKHEKFYPHSLVENCRSGVFNVQIFPQKIPELIRQLDDRKIDRFDYQLFLACTFALSSTTPQVSKSIISKMNFWRLLSGNLSVQLAGDLSRTVLKTFCLKYLLQSRRLLKVIWIFFSKTKLASAVRDPQLNHSWKKEGIPLKLNFEISSIFFDIFFWGSLKLSQTFQRFYTAGEWLFVEVDRSQDVEENSEEFEVSLYPLNLGSTYNILDQQYRTFATVNLHLGTELTDWLLWSWCCICRLQRRRPLHSQRVSEWGRGHLRPRGQHTEATSSTYIRSRGHSGASQEAPQQLQARWRRPWESRCVYDKDMFRCLLCKFYLFLTHVCCLFSAHKVLFHFTQ